MNGRPKSPPAAAPARAPFARLFGATSAAVVNAWPPPPVNAWGAWAVAVPGLRLLRRERATTTLVEPAGVKVVASDELTPPPVEGANTDEPVLDAWVVL